jgi:hypothetical protein
MGLGSEIRKNSIPDPGVKKGTGSRIRNTAFYYKRTKKNIDEK